ncbi:hypothetical protein M3B10_005830 [Micrococcus luteus]|nr:hypothetical protein [Micrococcus luteus]
MEVWTLHHPDLGVIELEQGFDAEFLARDPEWPLEDSWAGGDDGTPAGGRERSRVGERAGPDASFRERFTRWRQNPPQRLQVRVDGQVRGRFKATTNGVLPLKGAPAALKLADVTGSVSREKPHLRIQSSLFGELLQVEFREADAVVEFEPPADSRGERRHQAMESSSVKRVAYPLLGGLGKAGWAILLLVVIPLLGRLLPNWDVELPAFRPPRIHLPVPVWPRIELPVPVYPRIHLPVLHVDLPALPAWLVTVLEYDQIWKPILFGLGVGLVSLRNHRRSEAEKARWAQTLANTKMKTDEKSAQSSSPQSTKPARP